MFLREHAPEVAAALSDGLVLATVKCSCEYFAELSAFEEVVLRMRLADLLPTRLSLTFEYARLTRDGEEPVAISEHGGVVPPSRTALEMLPGVGRKTANVVMNTGFGEPTMAVDTHLFRLGNRTRLAPGKTPLSVELGSRRRCRCAIANTRITG